MTAVPYSEFIRVALPQVFLVLAAFATLTIDLCLRRRAIALRFGVATIVATLGCVAAMSRLLLVRGTSDLMQGMLVSDALTSHVQIALLALTVTTLLLSASARFTRHVGEYVLLILLAATGMMFLVSSRDVMVTFVSLELLSLSLYALTGFDKASARSAEASLKYFLFGGASAAFLLYGLSLVYGLANATGYTAIANALAESGLTPMLVLALIAVMVGLGFKVAAVPLHFWTPDVYQGAPSPVAGFIASSSKVASFFAFFVLMDRCFPASAGGAEWGWVRAGWVPILAVSASLSMVVGNLGALMQTSVRRLLAYSAIANGGYMLIGVVAHTSQSLNAVLYYVVTYSLSTLGMFAITGLVETERGNDNLSSFDGLSRQSPLMSACLLIFLLSQIGIPPLAGFFGKFYLFVSALRGQHTELGLLWLVVLALALSAVSLYYYLQVLKHAYVNEPKHGAQSLQTDKTTQTVVVLLALGVLVAGCMPALLMNWFAAR